MKPRCAVLLLCRWGAVLLCAVPLACVAVLRFAVGLACGAALDFHAAAALVSEMFQNILGNICVCCPSAFYSVGLHEAKRLSLCVAHLCVCMCVCARVLWLFAWEASIAKQILEACVYAVLLCPCQGQRGMRLCRPFVPSVDASMPRWVRACMCTVRCGLLIGAAFLLMSSVWVDGWVSSCSDDEDNVASASGHRVAAFLLLTPPG
eukprot:4640790-Amphidinium_carterae.2